MIISVQRKRILASALVVSWVLIQSPLVTMGQTSNNEAGATAHASGWPQVNSPTHPPGADNGTANNLPPDRSQIVAARRILLEARQALAHGDVDTAVTRLESAKQLPVDFQSLGDSPEYVQSMIQRQNQLIEMGQAEDPSYDAGAASFLLIQAEAMINYRDFETAEMLINQAKMFPVEFTPAIGSHEKLSKLLATAKQQAAASAQAEAAAQSESKNKVLKLLSQAQLAMDQENWNEAKSFVQQAKQLNVPDLQFAANEPRPWQLELKIQNALNRQSFDPAVMPSSFESQAAGDAKQVEIAKKNPADGKVMQADYDPNNDTTRNVQVAAMSDAEMERIPTSGLDFYKAGLKALTFNDRTAAIAHFQKAWENRQDLDGNTRQAIKDQIDRLVPDGSEKILKATLASQETDIDINKIKIDQRTAFSKLQSEVFKERSAAERLLETEPREALEKMTMVRGRIAQSNLDADSQRPLLAMIDRDINEMQKYIEQNLPDIMNEESNAANLDKVERTRQRRLDVEQQLQKLVDQYNHLIDEKRFAEAEVIVNQASDLAPDSELVVLLREKHRIHDNLNRALAIKAMKESRFVTGLADADEAAIGWDEENLLEFGDDLEKYTQNARRRLDARDANQYKSPEEARIYNLLKSEKVQGEYRGTLAEAMSQLSQQADLNIVFDDLALSAEGVKKDKAIDFSFQSPIALKSALDLILGNAGLVYVVESEVIKVTSKEARNSNLVTQTYYIGDLVVPMNQNPDPLRLNFQQPNMVPAQMGRGSYNVLGSNELQNGATSQLALAQQMAGNNQTNNPFNGFGGYGGGYGGGNNGPQTGVPTYATVGGQRFGGVTEQDFFPLIELIQNTINPASWQQLGQGEGSIQAYPPNLSLIVSQTQEIQDRIQDLLRKLRELNDVQIVIEVRFITLRDAFFEQIGIDFDFNINDNSGLTQAQAQADRVPRSSVVGRAPLDPFTPTPDLDVQFLQNSFNSAAPQFSNLTQATSTFGFAILSDIEVFFLIQASKGDTRSNIMQAPTVTMFNGQSANVSDTTNRPFVTSVTPVVGDFAVAHQPIITILPDGTSLDVQAVVSDDRRFVRLNLVPFFSQVTDVTTFTFDGSTTTQRSTNSILDDLLDAMNPTTADPGDDELETVRQGITIQQPVFSQTSVNTVVSVPDGGTVLLGGIKRMSEGRTESGIPFLSNIPYVSRLFKNTAIDHVTSNLMMMVTPRIIIQKELEEDQVGRFGN